jgi:hypothetical protein
MTANPNENVVGHAASDNAGSDGDLKATRPVNGDISARVPFSSPTLQNSGASDLSWTANTISQLGSYWLSFSSSGTIGAESSSTSNLLTAHPDGLLAPGSYWDTFTITYSDGTQRVVQVNLIVTAN